MTKTLIDVDDTLLEHCERILSTTTKKATVNLALREVARLGAIQELLQSVRDGRLEQPGGLVLADATALVRYAEPAVAAGLLPLLVLGEVATCAAVNYELGSLVGDNESASALVAALRRQGQPYLPWSRLVVAAVAERYSATVLHDTSDYDLISKVTGQTMEWVAAT